MDTRERDTTVVHTGGRGGSGANWFIAGIVVVALIAAGLYFYGGFTGQGNGDVNVSVTSPSPADTQPTQSAPAPSAPAGQSSGDTAPAQ